MADKVAFIKELAKYLVATQTTRSVQLQLPGSVSYFEAVQWRSLRATTPLFGYPTVEEAEQQLAEWFGVCIEKKGESDVERKTD